MWHLIMCTIFLLSSYWSGCAIICVTKLYTSVLSSDRKKLFPDFTGGMWWVMICSIFLAPLSGQRLRSIYIYLAWTSLLLMVKRSLHPGCGALNARALLVTYIFGATILLASAIISCGLLVPVFLLPLSFNRANSEQIYWPAVAWRLLGWNMFLNVSFTIYLKPYYL